MPRPAAPLPPLWLAASAVTSGITVVFGVQRWIDHFLNDPAAQDLYLHLVAARVGLMHGWSHIYDIDLQSQVARSIGPPGSVIDSMHLFISPPPTAWMMVPLAWQAPAVSYLAWTALNLAAFIAAGWIIVPGPRFTRATVLLVSLALWPVHYQFWQGQTVVATLVLTALAYWLVERERWALCGLAIAAAFCFKPQDVLLVPAALLISGRWKPVAAFAAAGSVMVLLWVATLGTDGVASWLHSLAIVQADPRNAPLTYAYLFGPGAMTIAAEAGLALAVLGLAWYRRARVDLVFCLGLVGSTMSARYLHEHDVTILVLGAWIALRARRGMTERLWLLAGIGAAQLIALGQPAPMLLWEPGWMLLLGAEPWLHAREPTVLSHVRPAQPPVPESMRR